MSSLASQAGTGGLVLVECRWEKRQSVLSASTTGLACGAKHKETLVYESIYRIGHEIRH